MPDNAAIVERLKQMRERTLADIEQLRDDLQAEIEPASATDDDSADVAADIYERSKIISLIQSLEIKLHTIEHAIELAGKGSYGICEMCGQPIPEERLEIVPETTLCVSCAAKLEQGIRRQQLLEMDRQRAMRAHAEEYDEDEEGEEDTEDSYDDEDI